MVRMMLKGAQCSPSNSFCLQPSLMDLLHHMKYNQVYLIYEIFKEILGSLFIVLFSQLGCSPGWFDCNPSSPE